MFCPCLQVSCLFDKDVKSSTTQVFSGLATVIDSRFTFSFLLSRIRWNELETDNNLALVSDWVVERFRLQLVRQKKVHELKLKKKKISSIKSELQLDKLLTLSWSGYHCGRGSSNILFSRGILTSPKKSLRPNISECQTVSHKVLVSNPFKLMWNCKSKHLKLIICYILIMDEKVLVLCEK